MECDNRFYLYTGHRFYVQYHLLLLLSRNPPPSQISELSVSKEGSRILRLRIGSCISLQREYQLPVELDTKDLPQFLLLLLGSAPGESWVVWVDSAWHCTSPHLQWAL